MAYRLRMYPTENQTQVMVRHCADARYVWNLGLQQRNCWRRGRRSVSVYDQKKSLAEARQHTWLRQGSSVVQQQALFDLDRAFKNWWRNPAHFRHPSWRKAGKNEGFAIRDLTMERLNRKWATVLVPKVGRVKVRLSRPWGEIQGSKSARVTVDRSGRWHVSLVAKQPPLTRTVTGSIVGLDAGIASSVTTSNGDHINMPVLVTPGEAEHRLRLQRHLARQEPGSNRRARTKLSLAKISAREVDRRKNWIEQTTTRLIHDHDFIAIENLAVRNMARSAKGTRTKPGRRVAQKSGLNRSIHNQAWGLFRSRLEAKAKAAVDLAGQPSPVVVIAVNPAFTSQCCSVCGHTTSKNRESQAAFACRACGYTNNADVNAAINILNRGLQDFAAGLAVTGRGAERQPSPPTCDEAVGDETSTLSVHRPLVAV